MHFPKEPFRAVSGLISIVALAACSQPPTETVETARIENQAMEIAIAAIPPGFAVISEAGPTIQLERTDQADGARLTIEATAELPGGINLVAEADSMKDWFEQQPDGQYFGNLELGTPNGPAFTARGAYSSGTSQIEELRVFALHPTANRMLRMTYTYPPGTGKERLQQLAEVLGEIEALAQNASDS